MRSEWVVMMIFWLQTASFLIMIYKSNLAAVFTIPKQTPMPFDSVEELIAQDAIPYRLIQGGLEVGTDVRFIEGFHLTLNRVEDSLF